ncbi:hypothetical protein ACLOJK_016443 [Asimina triloba]
MIWEPVDSAPLPFTKPCHRLDNLPGVESNVHRGDVGGLRKICYSKLERDLDPNLEHELIQADTLGAMTKDKKKAKTQEEEELLYERPMSAPLPGTPRPASNL